MAAARVHRKPGPQPRPESGEPVLVHLAATQLAALDKWMAREGEPPSSRAEAIQLLVEIGIEHTRARGARTKGSTAEASALARHELEQVTKNDTAPAEEQEKRKRLLLNGPKEFRDIRGDGQQRAKS